SNLRVIRKWPTNAINPIFETSQWSHQTIGKSRRALGLESKQLFLHYMNVGQMIEWTGVWNRNDEGMEKNLHSEHQLTTRSKKHTSELQSRFELVCRLLHEK